MNCLSSSISPARTISRKYSSSVLQHELSEDSIVDYIGFSGIILLMDLNEKRYKIFGDWDIPQVRLEEHRRKTTDKKSAEYVRAAELILESTLLTANIDEFLTKKQGYLNEHAKLQHQTNEIMDNLFELNDSVSVDQGQQGRLYEELEKNLSKLWGELRRSRGLEYEVKEYFQAVNLENYDRNTTKIEFCERQDAEGQLRDRVNAIKTRTQKLVQSLMVFEIRLELNQGLFSKDEQFQHCYTLLKTDLSHPSIIQVHMLMLVQLDQLHRFVEDLKSQNQTNYTEYVKYQAIYDCLCLMENHRSQMNEERAQMEDVLRFRRGVFEDREESGQMGLVQEKQRIVQSNIEVYRSNLTNFVRVNAETSMELYSLKRTKYTQCLESFLSSYSSWQGQLPKVQFLFEKYLLFEEQCKKQSIENKVKMTEKDKGHLAYLYNDCYHCRVQTNQNFVKDYKREVLEEMERQLTKRSIDLGGRSEALADGGFQKEFDFFNSLSKEQPQHKLSYLQNNSDLLYTLCQKSAPKSPYKAALTLCNIFIEEKNPHQKLKSMNHELKSDLQYRQLPLKSSQFIYWHIHDLLLLAQSQVENGRIQKQLNVGFQKVQDKMSDKKVDFDKVALEGVGLADTDISRLHLDYYIEVSEYSAETLNQHVQDHLKIYIKALVELQKYCPNRINKISPELPVSELFTARYLTVLYEYCQQPQYRKLLKIVNIDHFLAYVVDKIQKQIESYDHHAKLLLLAKLAMIEEYLIAAYEGDTRDELVGVVRKVKSICWLQTVIDWEVARVKNMDKLHQDDTSKVISTLMRLQFKLNSILVPTATSPKLSQQLKQSLRYIRRPPLTLASKHNISSFPILLSLPHILSTLRNSPLQATCHSLSTIFTNCQKLIEMKNCTELEYFAYENAVMKDRREISLFFQATRKDVAARVEGIEGKAEAVIRGFAEKRQERVQKAVKQMRDAIRNK